MYGDNKDCPIRLTSIVGYSKDEVEAAAERLVQDFQWRIHSRATLKTIERTVYSIILFNLTRGI